MFGAATDPVKALHPALVRVIGRDGEACRQGRAHRRSLETFRAVVDVFPVAALRPELRGVRERGVTEVRASCLAAGTDIEAAHTFRSQDPLVAGKGVHVGAGCGDVHEDVAYALGAVHDGQSAPLASHGADLLERQNLARGPVYVRERDEA